MIFTFVYLSLAKNFGNASKIILRKNNLTRFESLIFKDFLENMATVSTGIRIFLNESEERL